jgi:hypothetical protein
MKEYNNDQRWDMRQSAGRQVENRGLQKRKKMLNIIKNAEIASQAWDNLSYPNKDKIKRYFHLRPTNSGITLISTLPFAPMRGVNIQEKEINKILARACDNLYKLTADNKENALNSLKTILGMKVRTAVKEPLEEEAQAIMINSMGNDENLKNALNAPNKIRFIASELIFKKGNNRVDIIGFDGNDLYFFELKKDRTTKVKQVKDYLDYYQRPENESILRELLQKYPVNRVSSYQNIKGVMVMRHAEGSIDQSKWTSLAREYSISILFYKKALAFEAIKCTS